MNNPLVSQVVAAYHGVAQMLHWCICNVPMSQRGTCSNRSGSDTTFMQTALGSQYYPGTETICFYGGSCTSTSTTDHQHVGCNSYWLPKS
jgi:hypothetical protein